MSLLLDYTGVFIIYEDAPGRSCTDTEPGLSRLPLLVGLHEQIEHLRPVSITGLVPAERGLSSDARSEV